jgi:hypothetical protein
MHKTHDSFLQTQIINLNNNQKNKIGDNVSMKNIQNSLFTFALAIVSGVAALSSDCRAAGNLGDIFQIGQVTIVGSGKRDFLATPFVRPVESNGTGVVASVSNATTLVLNPDGADYSGTSQWTGGSTTQDKWHIVEILNGRYIGLVFLIGTQNGNTITTSEVSLPTDGALVGSSYAIRKDWTLSSLFGATDSASFPFAHGDSAATADTVNIFIQSTQAFAPYYVKASDKTWRNSFSQAAPHARVPYGQGVQVLRRATGNGVVTLAGEARKSRLRRDVGADGKFALLANLSLAPTTIQALSPSIDRGTSAADDTVQTWNSATGAWTSYYRRTSDGAFVSPFGTTTAVSLAAGKVVRIRNVGAAKAGVDAITAEPNLP